MRQDIGRPDGPAFRVWWGYFAAFVIVGLVMLLVNGTLNQPIAFIVVIAVVAVLVGILFARQRSKPHEPL